MRQKRSRQIRKDARAKVTARYKLAGKPIPKGKFQEEYNKDKKQYLTDQRKVGEPKPTYSRREARHQIRPESDNRQEND